MVKPGRRSSSKLWLLLEVSPYPSNESTMGFSQEILYITNFSMNILFLSSLKYCQAWTQHRGSVRSILRHNFAWLHLVAKGCLARITYQKWDSFIKMSYSYLQKGQGNPWVTTNGGNLTTLGRSIKNVGLCQPWSLKTEPVSRVWETKGWKMQQIFWKPEGSPFVCF